MMFMGLLAIPLLLCIIAVIFWRGWPRWAALLPLAGSAVCYAIDCYSWSQDGNLTGLLSLLGGPVAVVVLVAIWAMDFLIRSLKEVKQVSQVSDK